MSQVGNECMYKKQEFLLAITTTDNKNFITYQHTADSVSMEKKA